MPGDVESRSQPNKPPPPVTWGSLPHKGQLAVIASIRFADFFQQASLQAYQYYQLKNFSPELGDAEVSYQSGILQGVFTAAQIFTGVMWGRVADMPWSGRKTVILIGLIAQGFSCVGVAFASSFTSAAVWRCLGGAANCTVGGARTALAETTEKRYHSRTFLLLPLAFNLANIFGPILGGLLANPVRNYPGLFGPHSTFGGKDGVQWLTKFPYAAPNLLSAYILFADALLVWLFLRETLEVRKYKRDRGIEIADQLRYYLDRFIFQRFGYAPVGLNNGPDSMDDEELHANGVSMTPMTPKEHAKALPPATPTPPFYKALTKNVLLVLSTVAVFDFQMGGFASLWIIFLSSSRRTAEEDQSITLPFTFTGGLGFKPSTVGFAMSILGIIGIILQFSLYPRVNARFGLLRSTRMSLFVFPMAYALAPYLSLLATPSTATTLWIGIIAVLLLQVGARTFALPGAILLINNSSPSPAMLGTIHGMGAATSSLFRTIGPIVSGLWYAQGLQGGSVGYAWWYLAAVSVLGCLPTFFARDGA
jgi:MFS family permease